MSEVLTDDVRELVAAHLRDVPDWPEPGVVFKDITPLLRSADAFTAAVDAMAAAGRGDDGVPTVDVVAGIEARGFILAAPVAERLGVGFVPVRKEGKLPHDTIAATYALEYGEATIEVHNDAFAPGERVLVVDDVLATGGTVHACAELIRRCGASVAAVSVLIELVFLAGRSRVGDLPVHTLVTVD